MEPSTVKRMHPALLLVLMIGTTVLVRLGFALLRYTTDLKQAPGFAWCLEDGLKDLGIGFLILLAIRNKMPWYWFGLSLVTSSFLAAVIYRTIAMGFGREFYACLSPMRPPTPGNLLLSTIPTVVIAGVFWAGYALYRRWK